MGMVKFYTCTKEQYDQMIKARREELESKYYDPDFENNSRSILVFADKYSDLYKNLYMFLKATEDEVIYFDKEFNVRKFTISTEEDVLVEAF